MWYSDIRGNICIKATFQCMYTMLMILSKWASGSVTERHSDVMQTPVIIEEQTIILCFHMNTILSKRLSQIKQWFSFFV